MVHFIASDAHTCGERSPKLKKAFSIAVTLLGNEMACRLFENNGQSVLNSRIIEKDDPEEVKTGWFSLWF
jgi:tyrosine-protein phosphatase YwqE